MVRMGAGTGCFSCAASAGVGMIRLYGQGEDPYTADLRRPRRGEDLDPGKAWHVRVVEYEVPDLEGDGKG
jgi:hypothetical protein